MRLLYFIAFLLVISSCERDVNLKLPEHESQLVLNSLITNDSTVQCFVSNSVSSLSKAPIDTINNATVIITNPAGLSETLIYKGHGIYSTQTIKGEANAEYKITAQSNNYKETNSSTVIPSLVPINRAEAIKTSETDYQLEYRLNIEIQDLASSTNYYSILLFKIDSFGMKEIIYPFQKSENNNETDFYIVNEVYFDDALFNGSIYSKSFYFIDALQVEYDSLGNPIKLPNTNKYYAELRHHSRDSYLYQISKAKQQWGSGDPFSEPTQVYGNIKNGMGIFAGYAHSIKEIKK